MSRPNPPQFCQVNDVGVAIVVQVLDENGQVVNISFADSLTLKIERPDETTMDKTASLYSDGSDGKLVYVSQAGDFTQAGLYNVQGKIVIAGAAKSTRLGSFWVYDNIDAN